MVLRFRCITKYNNEFVGGCKTVIEAMLKCVLVRLRNRDVEPTLRGEDILAPPYLAPSI
jgi:hypothetical protein